MEKDLQEREVEIAEQIEVIEHKEDEFRDEEYKLLVIEQQLNDDLKNVQECTEVKNAMFSHVNVMLRMRKPPHRNWQWS